jgi:hypothetical protein
MLLHPRRHPPNGGTALRQKLRPAFPASRRPARRKKKLGGRSHQVADTSISHRIRGGKSFFRLIRTIRRATPWRHLPEFYVAPQCPSSCPTDPFSLLRAHRRLAPSSQRNSVGCAGATRRRHKTDTCRLSQQYSGSTAQALRISESFSDHRLRPGTGYSIVDRGERGVIIAVHDQQSSKIFRKIVSWSAPVCEVGQEWLRCPTVLPGPGGQVT